MYKIRSTLVFFLKSISTNLLCLSTFVLFVGVVSSLSSFAQEQTIKAFKGFVKVPLNPLAPVEAPGKTLEVFVHINPPAQGKPWVLLLNGMTYSTENWNSSVAELKKLGIGTFRLDLRGQGRTAEKEGLLDFPIPYQQQVEIIESVLRRFRATEKLNILGLSYGGGLGLAFAAKNPDWVENIFAVAPYLKPISQQDQWIRLLVAQTKLFAPHLSEDFLYDFYLRWLVFGTYSRAEPEALNTFAKIQAAFDLARGIRSFEALSIVRELPSKSLHLVVAGQDQYLTDPQEMDEFWFKLPNRVRETMIVFQGVEHKVPEAAPEFLAHWVHYILLLRSKAPGAPRIYDGDVSRRRVTAPGEGIIYSLPERTPRQKKERTSRNDSKSSLSTPCWSLG